MITHTAFDWLFRHALLSIKTSTSFLKGSNRGIANHKYAVRRAQLNPKDRFSHDEAQMGLRECQAYLDFFSCLWLEFCVKRHIFDDVETCELFIHPVL